MGLFFNDKIMFSVREYEKEMALNWGKKNNIEVTTSTELLSKDTVDQLKDYDGVTTMQFGKLEDEVYLNSKHTASNKSLNVLRDSICTI